MEVWLDMQQIQAGKRFLTKNLFLNASAGNAPYEYYTNLSSGGYDEAYNQEIGGQVEIGYRINYDLSISILNGYQYLFTTSYSPIGSYYSTGIKAGLDKRTGIFTSPDGYSINFTYQFINPFVNDVFPLNRFDASANTHLPIIRNYGENNCLYIALSLEIGYQTGQEYSGLFKTFLSGY